MVKFMANPIPKIMGLVDIFYVLVVLVVVEFMIPDGSITVVKVVMVFSLKISLRV